MTTILNIFIGYQDFLNPDQLIQLNNHSQNLGCLQNKKLIFLLGKNTLSMVLPNNGKIFGYSLFNNSMNFIYNHTLKNEDSIPLKINHNLVYNNGNTVINRSLIYDNSKNIINNLKFLKSYLFGSKEQINNNIILGEVEQVIMNEDPHTQEEDVQTKNVEDVTTTESSSSSSDPIIDTTTATTESSSSSDPIIDTTTATIESSSSSDPMIDTTIESSNKEKIVVFNNNIKITILNNTKIIDIRLDKKVVKLNFIIIPDEELKLYFKFRSGLVVNDFHMLNFESKNFAFFNNLYNNLNEQNYSIFLGRFFFLDENFREEFKILTTFYSLKEGKYSFWLGNDTINWFIQNKIDKYIVNIDKEINNYTLDNSYKEFINNIPENDYYTPDMKNQRNVLARLYDNKNNSNLHNLYYKRLDEKNLLYKLKKLLQLGIPADN